ncbi:MAG TPA: hypothetical protein VNW99_04810 [Cytophagaceae bacterium]|jgi:hypothetical protein|nr:hypothetical protein [Cytophagaceae bacterium]
MENQITITKETELKPSDIISSPQGKVYRIDTYLGNKDTFKVYPWPKKSNKDDFYIVLKKENLITKKWVKQSKSDLIANNTEENTEILDDSQNLFIKEGRQNEKENY